MSLNQVLNPVSRLDAKFSALDCTSLTTSALNTATGNFPSGITAGSSTFSGNQTILAGNLTLDTSGKVTTNQLLSKYKVSKSAPILTSGIVLTASQFIDGTVFFLGGVSGNIVCPSSASIDAELGVSTDGFVISLNISNGRQVADVFLIPPSGANRLLQVAYSVNDPNNTTYWFTRVGGLWVFVGD